MIGWIRISPFDSAQGPPSTPLSARAKYVTDSRHSVRGLNTKATSLPAWKPVPERSRRDHCHQSQPNRSLSEAEATSSIDWKPVPERSRSDPQTVSKQSVPERSRRDHCSLIAAKPVAERSRSDFLARLETGP